MYSSVASGSSLPCSSEHAPVPSCPSGSFPVLVAGDEYSWAVLEDVCSGEWL